MTNSNLYKVQSIFEHCELQFRLENADAFTPALEKKLRVMGFPKMTGSVLPNCVDESAKGVLMVNHANHGGLRLNDCRFPINEPTGDGHFEIAYSPINKSILLKLSGTFDCSLKYEAEQLKWLKNAKCLYITGCTLQDAKGKDINGPKDESGFAGPLKGRVGSNQFDVCQVPVKIRLEKMGK